MNAICCRPSINSAKDVKWIFPTMSFCTLHKSFLLRWWKSCMPCSLPVVANTPTFGHRRHCFQEVLDNHLSEPPPTTTCFRCTAFVDYSFQCCCACGLPISTWSHFWVPTRRQPTFIPVLRCGWAFSLASLSKFHLWCCKRRTGFPSNATTFLEPPPPPLWDLHHHRERTKEKV